jgi:malate permease and related proteins
MMLETFSLTFGTTFLSMLKILFIILIAGGCVRKSIITQDHLAGLSTATVEVFLPCLIFTNILFGLKPDEFDIWWVIPVVAIIMTGVGFALVALFFFRELPAKMNMLPIGFIHNSGYLVLPIGAVLYKDQFELFSVYVFLFILGQNPIMWSVGKYLATADPTSRGSWKDLVTTPLMAILLSLVITLSGVRSLIIMPESEMHFLVKMINGLLEAMKLLGEATVPVALFVLGGMLGGISFKIRPYVWDTVRVLTVKLIFIPLVTLWVLHYFKVGDAYALLAVFLVIQAAAAPAVSIMLQIKRYGGDEQKVGSILLVSYAACMVTLPLWVAVWEILK